MHVQHVQMLEHLDLQVNMKISRQRHWLLVPIASQLHYELEWEGLGSMDTGLVLS